MRRSTAILLALSGAIVTSCVPADEALPLGSVAFHVKASHLTSEGIPAESFADDWAITVSRVLLAFKTVTIGETDAPSKCAYRGRGAVSDVVFDPRTEIVQTFNGLEPTDCPDVGIVFGPPGDVTVPGPGATPADLVMLATGEPAHAYVELTATDDFDSPQETYSVVLRFATRFTSSRFGGCHDGASTSFASERGVTIVPNVRQDIPIAFAVDAFFRDAISGSAALRFAPFAYADAHHGNGDKIVTMDELDQMTLDEALLATGSDFYELSDGTRDGSFGDFVREQFKFAFFFQEDGECVGNDPGTQ